MTHTKFAVSRFENRNGFSSWRVEGRIHGVRFRRNFKSKEEAVAEKASLERKGWQADSNLRSVATTLTEEQVREAEALFSRVAGLPESLAFYLDYALAHYRAPEKQKPLAEATAEYIALKQREHERTLLSIRQLIAIRFELGKLAQYFPKGPVSQFTPELLTPYLERGKPSLKTYNNRRGLLSTFFKYAFLQKGWTASNPVEKTPYFRINHRRGSAVTITAQTAAELMAYVETFEHGELVPYFALCLFAGIRPCIRYGEITKLKPESVRLDTGAIHIEPQVSKVKMKRIVTIQPNLAVWLRLYPLTKFLIVPPDSMNTRALVFKEFGLTHDVLRHTFVSMFVAKFRSMGEAALQAGNSESIIRKHYLDLKSRAEADAFFRILPKHAGEIGARDLAAFTTSATAPALELAVAV
jgi:integrase